MNDATKKCSSTLDPQRQSWQKLSWNRHNLLANKRGDLPPTPLYNIPGGRQRQTHLCISPSFGKRGKGDILLPDFPWGVLVNLTEGLPRLFIKPLKHSLNARMLVNHIPAKTIPFHSCWSKTILFDSRCYWLPSGEKFKLLYLLCPSTTTTTSVFLSQFHGCGGNDWSMRFKRSQ